LLLLIYQYTKLSKYAITATYEVIARKLMNITKKEITITSIYASINGMPFRSGNFIIQNTHTHTHTHARAHTQ